LMARAAGGRGAASTAAGAAGSPLGRYMLAPESLSLGGGAFRRVPYVRARAGVCVCVCVCVCVYV